MLLCFEQTSLEPILEAEEMRQEFDIHRRGDDLLTRLDTVGQ
jgi:hypothetical protein